MTFGIHAQKYFRHSASSRTHSCSLLRARICATPSCDQGPRGKIGEESMFAQALDEVECGYSGGVWTERLPPTMC
eukprot:scaffold157580_cov36-Tisochrysis_lutea.AAC.2